MGIDAEMFVRTKQVVSDRDVERWAYRLGEAFGHERFFLMERDWEGKPRHAINKCTVYEQDGPNIVPEDGETFLTLSLHSRYYGEGYERGDLPFLIMLAEWLERNIPGGEVWYGGDSSGVLAKRFGKAEREYLFTHFADVGGQPYSLRLSVAMRDEQQPPRCEFCSEPMIRRGFGPNFASYTCDGCGKHMETRDGGTTWKITHAVGGKAITEEA